jgi:hypothetical protein
MEVTKTRLCAHVPTDIAKLVLSYVQSEVRNWQTIALEGEFETCMKCPREKLAKALYGACWGGHKDLVKYLIYRRGTTDFREGFKGACRGGHMDLIEFMIRFDKNWRADDGLVHAYLGEHEHVTAILVNRGAKVSLSMLTDAQCIFWSEVLATFCENWETDA